MDIIALSVAVIFLAVGVVFNTISIRNLNRIIILMGSNAAKNAELTEKLAHAQFRYGIHHAD